MSGSTVTLTWTFISGNNPNTASFMVEAGSASGRTDLANFDTGSTATSLVVQQVPNGIYFVRVRARNQTGASDPSNEITVIVGTSACTSAPSAPTGLTSTVSGGTVTLAWSAAAGGCAATSYVLQAGSSAGASNLANFNTGSTTVSYVATGVGAGTYYVRVLGANAAGQSAASNEVIVTVGGATPSGGVTGRWVGLVANGDGTSLTTNDCGVEKGDWQLDLVQTGTTVTGTLTQTTAVSSRGCDPVGTVKVAPLTGTAGSGTFSFALSPSRNATATFTASRMTGTSDFAGTFALNKQ